MCCYVGRVTGRFGETPLRRGHRSRSDFDTMLCRQREGVYAKLLYE